MAKPDIKIRRWLLGVGLALVLLGAGVLTVQYMKGPRFTSWVRGKIVAKIEEVTGGRVELQSIHWKPLMLEFDLRGLTIHGLEGPNEVPYAHADRVVVRAQVLSLVRRTIGLRRLELERPTVHLIVYPDGSTNQPEPKRRPSGKSPVEQLFDLVITRAEIRHGVLLINDHPVPLELAANDLAFTMKYVRRDGHYDGGVIVENLETRLRDFRPVSTSVDASFSLWRNRASLAWLKLGHDDSQIELRGELQDFARPKLDVSYKAVVDLSEVGRIARVDELRHGKLDLNGRGTWAGGSVYSAGRIAVQDLEYSGEKLKLRNAAAGADFTLDNQKISLPRLSASLFGGTVSGDALVQNWKSSDRRAEQTGAAHLRLSKLLLSQIISAFSTRKFPLDRAHMAGSTNGSVMVNWQGSPTNAVADIAAEITPPALPSAGLLPVTASMRGAYGAAEQRLEVQQFSLRTSATQIGANGSLGPRTGNIAFTLNTSNIGEWQRLIVAFGAPEQWPFEVRGQVAVDGNVSGRLSSPTVSGALQVSNFDVFALPSAQQNSPARRMHIDHLSAQAEYSARLLAARNAQARRGNAQVNFELAAQLQRGRWTETSPFTAQVSVRNGDVTNWLALAGRDYPVSGTVNFSVQLAGTTADPHGSGSLVINDATAYGEPVRRISSDVHFAQREVKLTNINASQGKGSVTGSAAYSFGNNAFEFRLIGSNLNIASVRRLQKPRWSTAGLLNFRASGSGTKDAPSIFADLQLRNLTLNGDRIGDMTANAVTTGDTLRLTARSRFENANLEVDGTARLRGDYPASVNVRFAHLDIDPLLKTLLKTRLTAKSMAMGKIYVQGPLRNLRAVNVAASIDDFSAETEHIQVRNSGPIRFSLDEQIVRIDQFRLVGTDTDMTANGTIQLSGARQLDVNADGHLNLKLVQGLYPDVISYGSAAATVRLRGTMARPTISGRVDISNGALAYVDLPNGLSDINGRLTFNQDRLQVTNLTAKTGGGSLNIGGFVTFGENFSFHLTAAGRDIRLRYPAGVSSMANADLRLTGNLQNSLLSGDVTVTKFGVNPQFDFASYLAHSKQTPVVAASDSPLSRIRLDVHVVSTPELQVQTSLAKLSGNLDLHLRGAVNNPVLLGRVNIVEGEISFNGTRYRLERGDITFTNPVRLQPVLDIQATTTVRSYDITLGFHGPTDKLGTTYRSDPPLATADIVSLLAFGRTREETATQTSANQNLPETASYAILNQALNAAVSSRMQKIFGVSRIKIDPQASGIESNSTGPTVTIEQQVANNLTITYISNISRANYQTIQAEYNVNRNVSIVATRDWNGVVSFDLRIRQRRK